MTIPSGTRLGPYEVISPLGAGGMGEVYRARDTRLGRVVALKVLPENLAADPERLGRFEREARAASALNHQSIVVVHDVGRSGSTSYIAMELVEGRTLRELMSPGPLPIKKLLPLAAQIAEGLARAHASGIVHRDLKPDNVMVTDENLVKILDFGLARFAQRSAAALEASATLSVHAPATESGTILGTVGYMSPEQAAGREVDYRSDQFSLGSILYEMLTGRRAFQGDSAPQTLAAIIEKDPEPIVSSRPEAPEPLCWVIERCLAKAPAERYESTRDLARDLATLRDRLSSATGSAAAVSGPPRRSRRPLPWAVAAGILAVGLVVSRLAPRASGKAESDGVIRFSVPSPEGASFWLGEINTTSAISPDGRTLAIVALSGGRTMIYLRPLHSLSSRPLSGTDGGRSPFWSPDSRSLAFFAGGKLKKIDAAGGPPQTICNASFEGTGSWSHNGSILFAEAAPGREGIHAVPEEGGQPKRVTVPDSDRKERFHFWPHFLPDGHHFLFVTVVFEGGYHHEVRIGSLDSPETEPLGPIDSRIEYARPGFLLFVREGALLARPFDPKARRWEGEERTVVQRLHYFFGPANAGFSVSQGGVLAYEEEAVSSRVVWLDRAGKEIALVASPGHVSTARLSPDGSKAALAVTDSRLGTGDIWVYDLVRGVSMRLTSEPADEVSPIWSPDGSRIVFRSDRRGPPDIYQVSADGAGDPKPLLERPGAQTPEDFSPDGQDLIFTESDRTTGVDMWLVKVAGEGRPVPVLRTRFDEDAPRISPDGRWIAYDSGESGESEVYVAARGGGGTRTRISTNGGSFPIWRRDGRGLFFMAPGRRLMAAPVKPGPRLEVGTPAELFRVGSSFFDFDVAPDGQQFLISKPVAEPGPPITIVVHWEMLLGAGRSRFPQTR